MLAIKLPLAKGPLKVSLAPTTLSDIPDTVSSILGFGQSFGGRAAFEMKPTLKRERKYYYISRWWKSNIEKGYWKNLIEFTISGSARDASAWSVTDTIFAPGAEFKAGTVFFGTQSARTFFRFGWSTIAFDEGTKKKYVLNTGSSASLYYSLPKEGSVRVKLGTGTKAGSPPIKLTLVVNGTKKDEVVLDVSGLIKEAVFTVGPGRDRPDVSVLEFLFSKPGGGEIRENEIFFETLSVESF
jgi:hypothetical protein